MGRRMPTTLKVLLFIYSFSDVDFVNITVRTFSRRWRYDRHIHKHRNDANERQSINDDARTETGTFNFDASILII